MGEAWNLSPEEWSKVLTDSSGEPEKVAWRLSRGEVLPWVDVLAHFTEDSLEILDLGCGHGENAAVLALKGKWVTLLDWSEENLEFCRKLFGALGKGAKFQQADMTKPLPFADRSFDTVFSCGVFEYFSDEQIKSILKEALRVSRKRVIIMVPNAWSVLYRVGMWYMKITKRWPWGGEKPFASLKPHFLAAGEGLKLSEFSVGAKHSLNFLTMPGGRTLQRLIRKVFGLTDHSEPSRLNQGYLLISVGERTP